MKKILLGFAVVFGATIASADSYLYWMVDPDSPYENYKTAKVKDLSDGTYLNLYTDVGSLGSSVSYDIAKTYDATFGEGFYASLVGHNTSASSFVIELFNDSGFIAQSETLKYGSASEYITFGGIGAPAAKVWAPTTYAVPEPNSALLMMLGFAVLGLRRRNLKA